MFLILPLATAFGCGGSGPPRGEVQGTVTFNGTPLESGSIAFTPIEGTKGPSTGGRISDGAYHIPENEGPVVGQHCVEIRATRPTGEQVKAGEGADDPEAMVDQVEMFIPAEYNSQSTLTAEIQAGTNELDFDLQGNG